MQSEKLMNAENTNVGPVHVLASVFGALWRTEALLCGSVCCWNQCLKTIQVRTTSHSIPNHAPYQILWAHPSAFYYGDEQPASLDSTVDVLGVDYGWLVLVCLFLQFWVVLDVWLFKFLSSFQDLLYSVSFIFSLCIPVVLKKLVDWLRFTPWFLHDPRQHLLQTWKSQLCAVGWLFSS